MRTIIGVKFIEYLKSLQLLPQPNIFLIALIFIQFPPYIAKIGLLGKTEDKNLYVQRCFHLIHVIYRIL